MSTVQDAFLIYNKRDGRAGWMNYCIVWWKADRCGYTYSAAEAGRYTKAEAESITGGGSSPDLVAVPESVVTGKQRTITICYLDDLPHEFILEKSGRARKVRQGAI